MTGQSGEGAARQAPEKTAAEATATDEAKESAVILYGERRQILIGPLPPPEILAGYEQVCSGAADRIISMAERQSAHRQQLESAVISANCDSQRRGPVFGFVLASMVIIIGGLLLWSDKDLAGLSALIAALASIVIPFVFSKKRQQSELEERRFREQSEGEAPEGETPAESAAP